MRRKEWGEELLGTVRNSLPIPLQSSEAGREGGDTGKGEQKLSLRRRAGGLCVCGGGICFPFIFHHPTLFLTGNKLN